LGKKRKRKFSYLWFLTQGIVREFKRIWDEFQRRFEKDCDGFVHSNNPTRLNHKTNSKALALPTNNS
jgi:hypothetical protein